MGSWNQPDLASQLFCILTNAAELIILL